MAVINLEKVGYIIHEMPFEEKKKTFKKHPLIRSNVEATYGINQRNNRPNFEKLEEVLGSLLGNPIQCNRSGKSDGETIRGDGKGINVSRKSKPGVGHKFPISSFFGTASRTNSFVASVSSPIFLSSSFAAARRKIHEANIHQRAFFFFFITSQPKRNQKRFVSYPLKKEDIYPSKRSTTSSTIVPFLIGKENPENRIKKEG